MIHQMNIYGKDKVETAIERLRTFEPPEGYFLAFSGGKDSVVIKALADMAGVKYDAHYSVSSVDPPELVQFVKTFPDVSRDIPHDKNGKPVTMWNLIPQKMMPPTRIARYCCGELKEKAGRGRFQITGVRWEESTRRSRTRSGLELADKVSKRAELYDPDNPDQDLIHLCPTMARRTLNPIIDWTTDEVWEFIHEYNVRYCELYDQGFHRIGCVGCPMATVERTTMEFERYPKFRKAYARAFDKMIAENKRRGRGGDWEKAEDVFKWWMEARR